nr:electron transfer flavoprotein subunit beta/FixA family protein [Planosporangium flavigriseum]
MNDADTYAVEEALRIRDEVGGEVVVVTAGDEGAVEALRRCVAMGADRAVRVWSDGLSVHDPIAVARSLAAAIRDEAADLVFCGVQSSDAAQQSTGPALASALGVPSVSVATKVDVVSGGSGLTVRREFEGGLAEVVELDGPAVITVQTGLNTPRYGSFKEMMKAKKAQIPVVDPGDAGASRVKVRRMFVPASSGGRDIEMIDGGPAQIAARIVQLVREVG